MKHFLLILATPLVIALPSCQTTTSTTSGSGGKGDPLHVSTPTQAVQYNISSSAGVESLVSKALTHHPAVVAANHKITRLQSRVDQENSLPDPKARIGMGNLAETATGQVDAIVGVEQQFPFPGKLKAKANAAQKEADAARAELENVKLVVAERVRFAYWDYYFATQNYRINQESRKSLSSVKDLVDALFRADNRSEADLIRTKTELSTVDKELIEARQQIGIAKAKLNSLLNRPVGSSLPHPKRSSIPSNRTLSQLIIKAETTHPEVKAAQARVDAFSYRLQKAHLDAYPDFLIGAQQSFVSNSGLAPSSNGQDQTMITLGMTIPLWQKPRRAKIDEANAGIAEMNATMANSRAGLRQRVEDAWVRAKSSREMIALYEDRLLPEAKEAHQLAVQAYGTGNESFIDVLDTWRLLLKFQLQQEGFRSSLGKASASLKSAAAIQ